MLAKWVAKAGLVFQFLISPAVSFALMKEFKNRPDVHCSKLKRFFISEHGSSEATGQVMLRMYCAMSRSVLSFMGSPTLIKSRD